MIFTDRPGRSVLLVRQRVHAAGRRRPADGTGGGRETPLDARRCGKAATLAVDKRRPYTERPARPRLKIDRRVRSRLARTVCRGLSWGVSSAMAAHLQDRAQAARSLALFRASRPESRRPTRSSRLPGIGRPRRAAPNGRRRRHGRTHSSPTRPTGECRRLHPIPADALPRTPHRERI